MLHKNGICINPVNLTITFEGKKIGFQKRNGRAIKFDLACRLILGNPAQHGELVELIYNNADGGPEWADSSIKAHLSYLKQDILQIGLRIYKENGGVGRAGYVRKWIAA